MNNPNPLILFSAIEEDDVAFLDSYRSFVDIKSMKQGVFDWWYSASHADFSVQSNVVSVLADGTKPTARVLVASSSPV